MFLKEYLVYVSMKADAKKSETWIKSIPNTKTVNNLLHK